jgi:hypothetical protein
MVQRSAGVVPDLSGNGNDGVLSGGVMQGRGPLGNYLAFDGVDGIMKANASGVVNSDFTFLMWVNLKSLVLGTFFSEGNSGNANPYVYLRYTGSALAFNIRDDSGAAFGIDSTATITDDAWIQVALVRDGNNMRVHSNGSVSADKDITALGTVTTDTLAAGCFTRTTDSSFSNACIMGLQAIPFAMSAAQIAAEYSRSRLALWRTNSVPTTGNVTSGYLGRSPFVVDSGSFKIANDYVGDGSDAILGSELLLDGDMEAAGTTAWTANDSTLSKETTDPQGGAQCLRITSTASTFWASQNVLTTGKNYRITGYARSDGTALPRAFGAASDPVIWTGSNSTDWQYFNVPFEAGQTTLLIGSGDASGYVEFDSVSIKEIRPNATVIECVSDGRCYVPTSLFLQSPKEALNGTLQWWQYKGETSNLLVGIGTEKSPSSVGNYRVGSSSAELYTFVESGISTLITSATPVTPYAWEKCGYRIAAGEIGLFLNGTSVGTATNSNITEATYLSFDMDAGDKIALSGNHSIIKRLLA